MALKVFGIEHEELFKLYVGKNTLNQFRQAYGYKADTDTYKRVWNVNYLGEDNEFLTTALKDLDVNSEKFVEDLYLELVLEYNDRYAYANAPKATEVTNVTNV
jgi:hypothetical protein